MIITQIGGTKNLFVQFWQTKTNVALNEELTARDVDTDKLLILLQ